MVAGPRCHCLQGCRCQGLAILAVPQRPCCNSAPWLLNPHSRPQHPFLQRKRVKRPRRKPEGAEPGGSGRGNQRTSVSAVATAGSWCCVTASSAPRPTTCPAWAYASGPLVGVCRPRPGLGGECGEGEGHVGLLHHARREVVTDFRRGFFIYLFRVFGNSTQDPRPFYFLRWGLLSC